MPRDKVDSSAGQISELYRFVRDPAQYEVEGNIGRLPALLPGLYMHAHTDVPINMHTHMHMKNENQRHPVAVERDLVGSEQGQRDLMHSQPTHAAYKRPVGGSHWSLLSCRAGEARGTSALAQGTLGQSKKLGVSRCCWECSRARKHQTCKATLPSMKTITK